MVDHHVLEDRLQPLGLLLHHELVADVAGRTTRPLRSTSSPTLSSRMLVFGDGGGDDVSWGFSRTWGSGSVRRTARSLSWSEGRPAASRVSRLRRDAQHM